MLRPSSHIAVLFLTLLALTVLPGTAQANDPGCFDLSLILNVAGFRIHLTSTLSEDGSCCGSLEVTLDPAGSLVPDLSILKRVTTGCIQWSF